MSEECLWGIDLGGTKIEGIVLESSQPSKVLCRTRIPTEGKKGYRHVLEQIHQLIFQMRAETGKAPNEIGIGTPGAIDRSDGLLRGSNSQHLNGMPIKNDLEKLLGMPVMIENDANCFALAETRMGVVPEIKSDAEIVFGAIIGTGVGGGIVINQKTVIGRQSIAGEWGHNYLDESGGPCYCGRVGCVETIISGPALENYYSSLSDRKHSLKEIDVLANQGDTNAKRTIDRLIEYFGFGIANVVNILDPDVIIIGGGVGNIDRIYTDGKKAVEKHIFCRKMETQIVKPKLGDSAGVFGAAFLTATYN